MFNDPIGNVWINREFVHTKLWPSVDYTLKGPVDLEKEYKEALAGKLVEVMEKGVDGSYLVYGETKSRGPFIWMIEAGDTKGFIPVIKKNGVLMPAGMPIVEQLMWMADNMAAQQKNDYKVRRDKLRKKYRESMNMPRKKKKMVRRALTLDWRINEWGNDLFKWV